MGGLLGRADAKLAQCNGCPHSRGCMAVSPRRTATDERAREHGLRVGFGARGGGGEVRHIFRHDMLSLAYAPKGDYIATGSFICYAPMKADTLVRSLFSSDRSL